jgi:pimeloyl-ACP methyl ester carboxylesterase
MNLKTNSATYIRCEGQGLATFVCDAGMGNWSLFFQPLFDELKKKVKVCLIDRKGYTDSRRPTTPRDAKTIATEMNKILGQYGINESIILVGHSLGGLNVRMYHHLYPDQVMGMVLLDAAHPELWERIPQVKMNIEEQKTQVDKLIWLAKLGLLKMAKKRIPTFGLPAELHRDYFSVTTRASFYQTYKMEMQAFGESLEQCKRLGNLGELPLLVISSSQGLNQPIHSARETSGDEKNVWIELQKELAELSLNSRYVESTGDHFVQLSDKVTVLESMSEFYDGICRSMDDFK